MQSTHGTLEHRRRQIIATPVEPAASTQSGIHHASQNKFRNRRRLSCYVEHTRQRDLHKLRERQTYRDFGLHVVRSLNQHRHNPSEATPHHITKPALQPTQQESPPPHS